MPAEKDSRAVGVRNGTYSVNTHIPHSGGVTGWGLNHQEVSSGIKSLGPSRVGIPAIPQGCDDIAAYRTN